MSREECRVQVTLHRADTAGAAVPALGQRLLCVALAAVAVLGEFGGVRGELAQGAAGACNRASQVVYEHPWGRASHALAVLLLPRFVREFFNTNGVATTDNLMDKPPVQAFAMSRQLALFVGKASSRGKIAAAVLPAQEPLATLLDAAFLIVVLWIVCPALAFELAF